MDIEDFKDQADNLLTELRALRERLAEIEEETADLFKGADKADATVIAYAKKFGVTL